MACPHSATAALWHKDFLGQSCNCGNAGALNSLCPAGDGTCVGDPGVDALWAGGYASYTVSQSEVSPSGPAVYTPGPSSYITWAWVQLLTHVPGVLPAPKHVSCSVRSVLSPAPRQALLRIQLGRRFLPPSSTVSGVLLPGSEDPTGALEESTSYS